MTKEQYLEQRNALLTDVENLIAEGKVEESNTKMAEVEALDNKWEKVKLANANLNALKDNSKVIDLENKNVSVTGTKVVDSVEKDEPVDESKAYENAWAKVMLGRKLDNNEKELYDKINMGFKNTYTHTTGTGADTASLIPQTVVDGIWKRAEEMYPLLGDVKKYNVRGTLIINKHTSISAGDAAWYDEATATADEQNVFGQIVLSGCELAKSITVSWKMKAMSIEEFLPFIKNELGERVGVALGTSVSQGLGKPGLGETFKPQPMGIEVALEAEDDTPQIVTYNPNAGTPDPITYAKITALVGKVHSSYLNGCAFYANNATIWAGLANVTDLNGRPIFIPDAISGGVGRMLGFVVKPDAGVSADNVIFGNAGKGYVLNTNEPMSLASEDHVKARETDYAAYAIVDGDLLDTKAFALLKKSA